MNLVRNLVVILGDQLDDQSSVLKDFDPAHDRIWMCEAPAESVHVWSHKARIALFLSAMRHHAEKLRNRHFTVLYRSLDTDLLPTLVENLRKDIEILSPIRVVLVEPGEWRLRRDFESLATATGIPFEFRPDAHFMCSLDEFKNWSLGRSVFRLENFYRWMRTRTGLLMNPDDTPAGNRWNFDAENRSGFGNLGPSLRRAHITFKPDGITSAVINLVSTRYKLHPGSLEYFDWPVTREDALEALDDFLQNRLPQFGTWQDAMWTEESVLWHSRLSAALNLHLLNPLEVCKAAENAWRMGNAPLHSVEGFIRQILGWREYVRGLYWIRMPEALAENSLAADQPLPGFYWTGDTSMNCLRQCIGDTLRAGYAHHIQRLMVTGLYALLLGVEPRQVHEWYLAIYVDAVEWVELPNTLGMSQYADGGRMASKPYIASGRYIQRMSNYCEGCVYRPEHATGPEACPITSLYWDFLDRHSARFSKHPRIGQQVKNWERKAEPEKAAIREKASLHRLSIQR